MSLDELRREDHGDSLVVLGRDAGGNIRGFLHFAPSYGRPAVSLSLMRRHPDTPNGLMEFLVARGLELLRERGVREVSLNFAAFARFVHQPRGLLERLVGRGLLVADAIVAANPAWAADPPPTAPPDRPVEEPERART